MNSEITRIVNEIKALIIEGATMANDRLDFLWGWLIWQADTDKLQALCFNLSTKYPSVLTLG
jgi:hypothetical protein